MNKSRKKYKKINKEKILFFTTELNIMLKSGITFSEALNILYTQEKNTSFKYILEKIYRSVRSGKTIFDSFSPFSKSFGENYVYMIKIGEASGSLTERLEDIIKNLEFSIQNKKKISSILVYPITILIFTLFIISFLILNILPNFIDIFEENNIELPLMTKILLSVFNNFVGILIALFFISIFLIFLSIYINKDTVLKYKKDKFLFFIPFVKVFYKYSFSFNFYRTFSILLNAGINIDDILEVLHSNNNNLFLKNKIFKIKKSIVGGSNIANSLKYIDFFDRRFFTLIASSEESGALTENLFFISEILKQDLEYKTKKFLAILEPLIMLILGIIVGFIIIAIYLPIISINNIF